MAPMDYLLCGWCVRSALALPELLPWPFGERTVPDITIRETSVPAVLDNPVTQGESLVVSADGSVLLHIKGLVRILARGGNEIFVEILRHEASEGWRLFLLGSTLGHIIHQRGLFPLHAACLKVAGRTIAIAGASGMGKSTLAMAMVQRGHALLSDDLTVIQQAGLAIPHVLPAFPRLKLWRDTLEKLAIDPGGVPRVRDGMDKFNLASSHSFGFDPAPSPLHAVLLLNEQAALGLAAVPVLEAAAAIRDHMFRPGIGALLGKAHQGRLFRQSVALASTVKIRRLQRPKEFAALAATIDLIEEHFAS